MISKKELSYVNSWANRVPNPGNKYCLETKEYLKEAIELYNKFYKGNKYNITFSNNEEIEFEIKEKNLAHMLGIDTKNLFNEVFNDFWENILKIDTSNKISSFEILNLILDNFEDIMQFDKREGGIKVLNYYKVYIKSYIFSKLGNLSDFKYGCINFDKEEFLRNNDNKRYNSNSTKFLYLPSDEPICPYFAMGILPSTDNYYTDNYNQDNDEIVENEKDKPYVVETSIAIDKPKPFFENQEVIIPTQILKDTNKELTRTNATPEQKKNLLREYRNIITQYNIDNRINIYSDYYAMLSEQEKAIKLIK